MSALVVCRIDSVDRLVVVSIARFWAVGLGVRAAHCNRTGTIIAKGKELYHCFPSETVSGVIDTGKAALAMHEGTPTDFPVNKAR